MRAVLSVQAVVIATSALAYGLLAGVWHDAAGVLAGGAAAMLNAGMLWWHWRRGLAPAHSDPGRHLGSFYRSSLERFFVVGISLAVGFTMSTLQPLALLTGFVVGQLALIGAQLFLRERT